MLSIIKEQEIILIEVTGLIIEIGVHQEMIIGTEEMTGLIIDKVTEEKIIDKSMVSKDTELEVQVRIVTDLDKGLGTVLEVGINIVETRVRDRRQWSRTVSRDRRGTPRSESMSRSSSHVNTNRDRLRCFRCSEYDQFARECPNMMTEDDSDQEDLNRAILQDDTLHLDYAEMEGLNMKKAKMVQPHFCQ